MGREINLKKRVVQVWFQNARAKEKKNHPNNSRSILFSNSANNDLSNYEFSPDECIMCNVKYNHNSSLSTPGSNSQAQRDHLFSKGHLNKLIQFVTNIAVENGADLNNGKLFTGFKTTSSSSSSSNLAGKRKRSNLNEDEYEEEDDENYVEDDEENYDEMEEHMDDEMNDEDDENNNNNDYSNHETANEKDESRLKNKTNENLNRTGDEDNTEKLLSSTKLAAGSFDLNRFLQFNSLNKDTNSTAAVDFLNNPLIQQQQQQHQLYNYLLYSNLLNNNMNNNTKI